MVQDITTSFLPINLGTPEAVSDVERIVAQANLSGEAEEIPDMELEDLPF